MDGGRDMGVCAVALESGFDDDDVTVLVDDRVLLDEEHLSTRHQVGLAWMLEVPVEPDEGEAVRLPNHGLAGETGVQVPRSPSLRISVETDYMAVSAATQDIPFYARPVGWHRRRAEGGELHRTGLLLSPRRPRIGDITQGRV